MKIEDERIGSFSPEEAAYFGRPVLLSGTVIRGPAKTLREIEEYCVRAGIPRAKTKEAADA